jgi:hypothetical protein
LEGDLKGGGKDERGLKMISGVASKFVGMEYFDFYGARGVYDMILGI